MTDKEVLKKAIDVAVDNGYEIDHYGLFDKKYYYPIIFSHDFAKAFFPDGDKSVHMGIFLHGFVEGDIPFMTDREIMLYEYFLMNMVRYSNPIDYLRKFVKDE